MNKMTPAAMKSEKVIFSAKVTRSSTLMSLDITSFLYLTRLKKFAKVKVDNRQTDRIKTICPDISIQKGG